MPSIPTHCDHDLLQRSLNDALDEDQEERLAAHLAECGVCRQRLESLAGSNDDWSRIERALRTESDSTNAANIAAESEAVTDNRFIADFAVDFLEPALDADSIGQLGNIAIREVIGQGGNGIVLKGHQSELNRLVAAKVMAPHLAASAAARKRFSREAQATAAIVHPSVMPILSVNSSGRLPYLVMPYVDCESLQQRLDREGPLSTVDVLRIGVQVARGLAAAHAQGLVHRDVKPANILLEKGVDRAMLTDFGLARAIDDASLTRSGLIAGTPQYMSPEQARGESVDTRSDLFSLGSVLYAMCTGRPPFRADTSYGILRRVTDDAARPIGDVNSDIPDWLNGIVQKLLSKLPDDRFENTDDVADLLEDCVAHVQQPTVNALPKEVGAFAATNVMRWRKRLATVAGITLVAVVGAAVGWTAFRTVDDESLRSTGKERVTAGSAADTIEPEHRWTIPEHQELDKLESQIDELMNEATQDWLP